MYILYNLICFYKWFFYNKCFRYTGTPRFIRHKFYFSSWKKDNTQHCFIKWLYEVKDNWNTCRKFYNMHTLYLYVCAHIFIHHLHWACELYKKIYIIHLKTFKVYISYLQIFYSVTGMWICMKVHTMCSFSFAS